MQFILDHTMYLFVEASPRDEYFGRGRELEKTLCFFPSQCKYENVLGLLYTEVALHFTEFGPQEFVDEEEQALTGEQLEQRRQIVWDRMQAAVLNYQAGRLHPPYFDLPGEPYYTRYMWDPQVGDATLPPGLGIILPAAPFQVGEDWQHKPAKKNLELIADPKHCYFPAALLIRRRMRQGRSGQHQWLYNYRRPRGIIIPWRPARIEHYPITYWVRPIDQQPPPGFPPPVLHYHAARQPASQSPGSEHAPASPDLIQR